MWCVVDYIYEDYKGHRFGPDRVKLPVGSCMLSDLAGYLAFHDEHVFRTVNRQNISVTCETVQGEHSFRDNVDCRDFHGGLLVLKLRTLVQVVSVQYTIDDAGTVRAVCDPGLPPQFQTLDLATPLQDVLNWLRRGTENQLLELDPVDAADEPVLLKNMSVYLFIHETKQPEEVENSLTMNKIREPGDHTPRTAHCLINCCPEDSLQFLDARLVHELTHAIRYLLSVQQHHPQAKTPVEVVPPHLEGLYCILPGTGRFDSGFLAEHLLREGVLVLLRGFFKETEAGPVSRDSRMARVVRSEFVMIDNEQWEKFFILENGGQRHFFHCGKVVFRSD